MQTGNATSTLHHWLAFCELIPYLVSIALIPSYLPYSLSPRLQGWNQHSIALPTQTMTVLVCHYQLQHTLSFPIHICKKGTYSFLQGWCDCHNRSSGFLHSWCSLTSIVSPARVYHQLHHMGMREWAEHCFRQCGTAWTTVVDWLKARALSLTWLFLVQASFYYLCIQRLSTSLVQMKQPYHQEHHCHTQVIWLLRLHCRFTWKWMSLRKSIRTKLNFKTEVWSCRDETKGMVLHLKFWHSANSPQNFPLLKATYVDRQKKKICKASKPGTPTSTPAHVDLKMQVKSMCMMFLLPIALDPYLWP